MRPNSKPDSVDVVRMLNTRAGARAWNVTRDSVWTCTADVAGEQVADAGDDENGQDVGGENPQQELRGLGHGPEDHMS